MMCTPKICMKRFAQQKCSKFGSKQFKQFWNQVNIGIKFAFIKKVFQFKNDKIYRKMEKFSRAKVKLTECPKT